MRFIVPGNLTCEQMSIVRHCLIKTGPNKHHLRESKPPIEYIKYYHKGRIYRVSTNVTGKAAFLWRMLVFELSNNPKHHCMPIMAWLDLPVRVYESDKAKQMSKELQNLADRIMDLTLPKHLRPGLIRWM